MLEEWRMIKRRGIYCWVKEKSGTLFYYKKHTVILTRRNLNGVKNGMDIEYGAWEPLIVKVLQFCLEKIMKYDIYDEKKVVNGRYIQFKIKHGDACYQIFKTYAPVDEYERVKFMNEISSSIIDDQDKKYWNHYWRGKQFSWKGGEKYSRIE